MRKFHPYLLIAVVAVLALGYFFRGELEKLAFRPTESTESQGLKKEEIKVKDIEVIAQDLGIPWELAFLPDGSILVTERPGALRKIGPDGAVIPVSGVEHIGEGGLLGLALDPDFENNNFIYLYLTTKVAGGLTNRVERYRLLGNELLDRTLIIGNIPGAAFHDGGRVAFGPDGLLYITTGDAGNENSAQDINSLAGKILRLNKNGAIPEDNPFGNAVYAYGHRNPQGLAWDDEGQLWATEHGRSGVRSGFDELNLIKSGQNYGWPVIEGDEASQNMIKPIAHSGPSVTWAPAGAVYLDGSIFFAGLRGQSLYQAKIGESGIDITAHFRGEFGRLRAVVLGPDGFLYITTSNTDGRGQVKQGDDKIIKINPEIF